MRMNRLLAVSLAAMLALLPSFSSISMARGYEAPRDNEPAISDNAVVSTNQATTFEINNIDDFLEFAEKCRKNSWSKGRIVKLNVDIDLGGAEFEGIPSFSGYFVGNGHTISNLNIVDGDEAMGLFRYLEADGKISDLTVTGYIYSSDSRDLVGGIVGVNSGTIIGCTFDGKIKGVNVAGGIVGLNGGSGTVMECTNEGFLTSQTNVGGIVGINRGMVSDCVNNGNVNSDSSWVDDPVENDNTELTAATDILSSGKNIGGICGWSNGIVATSTNNGTVGYLKTGENVGGIIGCHSGSIFYCRNNGKVYGKQDVGGIIGQFEPTIVIKDIQEIKDEIDKLHEILDKSNGDIDRATDSLTSDMDSLNKNADNLNKNSDNVLDEGLDNLESNTDVLNDFSERADYVTKHLTPINNNISTALKDLDRMNEILDKMENDTNMSQDDRNKIKASREKIDARSKDMKDASEKASAKLEEANAIAEDIKESGKVTPSQQADLILILTDSLEYLADASNAASDIMGYVNDINNVVGPYMDSTSDALSEDVDKFTATSDEMLASMTDANDLTGAIINYLNSKDKIEIINFSTSFDENVNKLQDEVDSTINTMDRLNKNAETHSDILEEDLKVLNDQSKIVIDLVIDRIANFEAAANGDDVIVDVSENDKEGNLSASITGCYNAGNVDGTSNVGGIVGSISLDSQDENKQGLGSKYEVSAVILASGNEGFITVKNKNGGGIAGNVVAGYIGKCESKGGVISEEGNYIGGIAGNCQGSIENCNSMAVLAGGEYLGGIAGVADDVNGCLSVPMILEYKGRIGAVIGAYQSDNDDITVYHQGMSDHIHDNYFVSDVLFGIDSVSYTGVAEPIEYDELAQMTNVFSTCKVYFVDEDYNIISTMQYRYGYDLTSLKYPEVSTDNKTYAEWDKPQSSELTTNLVLRSVVVDNVTIIACSEMINGKALVLAEGVFTKEAVLSANKIYDSSANGNLTSEYVLPEMPANATMVIYDVKLLNTDVAAEDVTNIRVLQEYEGKATIYVLKEGQFVKIDANNIGSYWQLGMNGDSVTILIATTKDNPMLVYIIAGVVGFLAIIAVAVIIGRKRKSKNKK